MSHSYDELLYSLIISQLKDDGFFEEADSLQRKVVNAVFNIEASRQLRKIVEIMSITNGMSWRKLTTNSQCPQGVILNLKPGSESPTAGAREEMIPEKFEEQAQRQPLEPRSQPNSAGLNTAEHRIGEIRETRNPAEPALHNEEQEKDDGSDEQKWKKEMEHMRFDFKLSRKVDFKIHNFDPSKKRAVPEDKNLQKRMKGSSASQGKFFHIKMSKDFMPEEKKGPVRIQNLTAAPPPPPPHPAASRPQEEPGDGQKGNLQDFLQKITIPMDKLN